MSIGELVKICRKVALGTRWVLDTNSRAYRKGRDKYKKVAVNIQAPYLHLFHMFMMSKLVVHWTRDCHFQNKAYSLLDYSCTAKILTIYVTSALRREFDY